MPTSFRPVSLRSFLPFLILHCLLGLHCQLFQDGVRDDLWTGKNLSSEEAMLIEEKLATNPKDVISRTRLLGYYWEGLSDDDGSALAARRGHVLWLVRNLPEAEVLGHPEATIDSTADPEGYSEGRKAWMNQLDANPENVTILGHAAHFLWSEDGETATELLERARSLDPSNAEWSEDLARRYARTMYRGSPEATREAAEKALKFYEIAFELSDELDRETLLEDLAKVAFEAGRHDKARQYAESMLQDAQAGMTWNYGNRVHHGNLVLGRIALSEGNVKAAKFRLAAAGNTPGSPQLDSFGPNMTLAKDFLERGERDVVLKYFRLCSKFWDMDFGKLDEWAALVKEGKVPDFGANLKY